MYVSPIIDGHWSQLSVATVYLWVNKYAGNCQELIEWRLVYKLIDYLYLVLTSSQGFVKEGLKLCGNCRSEQGLYSHLFIDLSPTKW